MLRDRIMRRLRLNRLFFRILLYFISLLLPIIITGIVFYSQFFDRVKVESLNKLQLNLHSAASTIDIYLRTAQETSFSIFHDHNLYLLPYAEYNDYDRIRMADVSRKLSNMSISLGAITDHLFFYADDSVIYSAEGIDSFSSYFDRLYTFELYDKTFWRDKLLTGKPLEFLQVSNLQRRNGSLKPVVPIVMTDTLNGHRGVMVTTISVEMLEQTIRSYMQSEANWFVVTDHLGQLILNSYPGELKASSLMELTEAEAYRNGRSVQEHLRIEGTPSIAVHYQAETYGWHYYSILPISDLKQQSRYVLTLIVIICLTLVVIGIGLAFFFTFNLYTPIKRLRDFIREKNGVFDEQGRLPDYADEFQQIDSGIHQLIKRTHDFKSNAQMMSAELNDRLIVNYLYGYASPKDENELRKRLQEQLFFKNPGYVCCHVKFDFKVSFYKEIQDTDRLIILDKIKSIVWAILRISMHTHVVEDDHQLYICLFNLREQESLKHVKQALQHLIDTFKYDLQYCCIHIGVGRVHHDLQGLKQSHIEAIYALEAADSELDFQIVDASELPSVALQYVYSVMDESIVLNCLQSQNETSLIHKIDEILQKNEMVGSHRLSSLITDIYRTGCRLMAEYGEDPRRLGEPEEYELLRDTSEALPDVAEKKQLLIRFCVRLMQWLGERNGDTPSKLIPSIIEYVETHYLEDLYLEKIADELGVSAKYVSRAFSEKIGVTLSHYISSYRMSKAKELLERTDMKISDISEGVGIFSRSTFIRLFKRHVGITPLEYRKLHKGVSS